MTAALPWAHPVRSTQRLVAALSSWPGVPEPTSVVRYHRWAVEPSHGRWTTGRPSFSSPNAGDRHFPLPAWIWNVLAAVATDAVLAGLGCAPLAAGRPIRPASGSPIAVMIIASRRARPGSRDN